MAPPDPRSPASTGRRARFERQARALRANLQRRKMQARQLARTPDTEPPAKDPGKESADPPLREAPAP